MLRILNLFFILVVFQPISAQYQKLDTLLPRLMEEVSIPGLSIAALEDGQIVYSKTFGVVSNETREPVTGSTVFAAASLSKPVFAYAVLQLAEEGKFDLDRPLHQYLPYPDIERDDRYRQITGRMALSHTSGFPNWRDDSLRMLFAPGERFSYSGEGFVYLQKVIEKVTGEPLEDLVRRRVFVPLEMNRSSYLWQKPMEADYARPHDELGRTQGKYRPEEGNSAHSLQTTAEDYARFVRAILNGKGLKEATIRQMLNPQMAVPERWGQTGALHERISWGLGWGLEETPQGRYFWHWGDNGTFKAFVIANTDRKSGLVYLTNGSNGLSIMPALLAATPLQECGAATWLSYGRHDDPSRRLLRSLLTDGYDQAIRPFLAPGGQHHDTTRLSEGEMNRMGYLLLRDKRIEDALKVLHSNMLAFPYSSNVYDSYAEANLVAGNYDRAAEFYAKAAALNPENELAKRVSEQLGQPMSGSVVFRLDGYPNARLVSLAGDFNGWTEWKNIMRRREGGWECRLDLPAGTYQYKFVVDGVWILDPANPESRHDGRRHVSVRKLEETKETGKPKN